jgi:thiol-disulfide isomerase/thioredoxin
MLLRAAEVRRELGLTAGQAQAVQAAAEAIEQPLWRLRDLPPEERNVAARGHLRALDSRLSGILTPAQMSRLGQLVVQGLGARAVLEPQIATRMALLPGQKERIRAAFEALSKRNHRLPTAQVDAAQTIAALLTDPQRQAFFREMGAPFDLTGIRRIACRAPELTGVTEWINTSPLTLAHLRGKVVAVHFYAFGCINCVRNLPHYNAWNEDFSRDELVIIGVHRPETEAERSIEKVRTKAANEGMTHAIAIDNDSANWDAWVNRVWPSVYLVDKQGFVRYWWYGELNWQGTPGEQWMRARIRELAGESDPSTRPALRRAAN